MAKQLLVESIRIDGQTQSRERINPETVDEYAEAMKAGANMPPVLVFFDGKDYWPADGFHRLLAAKGIGRKNIMADVKQGSRQDATWASCAANQTHGLRRTNADKRKSVEIALKLHPELSDRAIANHCGVGRELAFHVRHQVVGIRQPERSSTHRTGADGKRYPVPAPKAKAVAGQSVGPCSRTEFTAGRGPGSRAQLTAGHGPPPRAEERRNPAAGGEKSRAVTGEVDDLGRRIPDHLLELWGRRQEVQDMMTAVSRVRVALEKAQQSRDPLFSEVPFSSAIAHLEQAYNAVQVAKPYAVCAFCQGEGCKACGQRGLLGKFRWDTSVPREHKEAVARLIEKQSSREATAGKAGAA